MLDSINTDQRLYVLTEGTGYTCLGFDVAERRRHALAQWTGMASQESVSIGTQAHYDAYRQAMAAAYAHHQQTGERCPVELEPRLIGLEGWRIEVTRRDGTTQRYIVGKSTGWLPCHLAIKQRNSIMGDPVSLPKDATITRLYKVR